MNYYIFGAGLKGLNAYNVLKITNNNVLGFIDNDRNKWGTLVVDDKKIYSIDEIDLQSENFEILIMSDYYSAIKEQLDSIGYKNYKIPLFHEQTFEIMPTTELEGKHIANVKHLLDREQLLKILPKQAVCAEIGVASGDFSEKILSVCNPSKLHLVDIWTSVRYGEGFEVVRQKFGSQIQQGKVVINRGDSVDVLNTFENGYFDWVYIDTVHDYKTTRQELQVCKDKIKLDGIIAGHDYCRGNLKRFKYGVVEAVYEFCKTENFQIIYITSEMKNPSFALIRL